MRTCMPSLESGAPEYTAHPASKACTQEGKMEDEGEDQVIATFQSVTGRHGFYAVCLPARYMIYKYVCMPAGSTMFVCCV